MSRTDRHRPRWVQVADPFERDGYWFAVWPDKLEWVPAYNTCSCQMCGMGIWRRAENRQRRHTDQRRAREARKGHLTAWDGR